MHVRIRVTVQAEELRPRVRYVFFVLAGVEISYGSTATTSGRASLKCEQLVVV